MNDRNEETSVSPLVPGAVIVRGAIPREIIARFAVQIADGMDDVSRKSGVSLDDVARVTEAWDHSCGVVARGASLIQNSLRAVCEALGEFGADVDQAIEATLFVTTHHHTGGTHAHQDLAYRWNRPEQRYALTTWVPLDECDETNGALTFSANFSREQLEPRLDFLRSDFVDRAKTARWQRGQVVAAAKPGDAVVFDSCVWHAGTSVNHPLRRKALAIRWTSKSGWERDVKVPVPEPHPNLETFGMDNSGTLIRAAILAASDVVGDQTGNGSAYSYVSQLFRDHPTVVAKLNNEALHALSDLKIALALKDHHCARPSADVWRNVRDYTIPALRDLARKEQTDGLA